MPIFSHVVGCGSHLPDRVVTNDDLAKMVDTSDEWIVARTGVRCRRLVAEGEYTSDLAVKAAENALAQAGVEAYELDLIVVATTTPDKTFPSTAVQLQNRLGMGGGAAFDVQAVCTGFVYALAVVDSMIRGGQVKTALVVGAETMSRIIDWTDRATCVLFGDGAGAVVLKAAEENGAPDSRRGVLSTHIHSDGRYEDLLFCDGGPSTTGKSGYVRMQGREVFRHAVNNLAEVVDEALAANGLSAADIDWFVPHQANKRIIDGTARKLKLSKDRVVLTIEHHANTSAASIPLALDVAVRDGRIQPGHLILMEAMGGGLTWGSALVRW